MPSEDKAEVDTEGNAVDSSLVMAVEDIEE